MISKVISLNFDEFVDQDKIRSIIKSNGTDERDLRNAARDFLIYSIENDPEAEKPKPLVSDSYKLILWILRAIGEKILTARIINQQRDSLEEILINSDPEDIEEYALKTGFIIEYDVVNKNFKIPVESFVKFASRLSGSRYRLAFQSISKGKVFVSTNVVSKIIREFFVQRSFEIYDSIKPETALDSLELISDFIYSMRQLYKTYEAKRNFELGDVDFSLFPPCMKEYIKQMKEGVNLPHLGRFTLVSFLSKVGMSRDEIIDLFKTAPDYNERMTVYQVDHVTGKISGTEYSPPKCAVLKSNHLCYMGEDPLCNKEWLVHPLQYYSIKKRPKKS